MNFALSGGGRRVLAVSVVSTGLFVAGGQLAWTAGAAPASHAGTKIVVRHSPQGKVLTGKARKFAYVHLDPTGADVACTSVCAGIWPVATTTGKPRAGAGVKAGKLGRASGHQVTYCGHRLYYYSFSPQSTAGDDAVSFGGTWKLITAKCAVK